MPKTKGSKNRPKTNNDYVSQITEKEEQVVTLTTEIASIQKAIEEQKNTLKEKRHPWKRRKQRQTLRPLKKLIGDNVYIGPGAKIFGGIRVGNNVRIYE